MEKIKKPQFHIFFKGLNTNFANNTSKPIPMLHVSLQGPDAIEHKKTIIKERIINKYPSYQIIKYPLDVKSAMNLKITNLRPIGNNSLRGETLSSRTNRWALRKVRQYGIENIIDLREKYTSLSYKDLCQKEGLRYYHFPIDSCTTPDKTIIQNFALMFKVLNEGRCYIACAQGLHRTDLALALNYIFNPASKQIPIMAGHYQDKMDIGDIKRRINSISKTIKDEDLKNLGWEENAREIIQERKAKFIEFFEKNKPENYYKQKNVRI